jgi:hypothetical protein
MLISFSTIMKLVFFKLLSLQLVRVNNIHAMGWYTCKKMADCSKGSLALLGAYLSDGSSDEEIPGPKVSTKRQASKEWSDQNPNKKISNDGNKEK